MKKLEKYLPKINVKNVVIILIILFLALILMVKRNKEKNFHIWNTILYMPNYNQDVELSVEERLGYEAEVQKYDDMISNFVPWTGEEIDLGNGMKGIVDNSTPSQSRFVSKAEAYKKLGNYNKAIKTLYKAFDYDEKSQTIRDELANVYNEVGEYYVAIKYYELILANYADQRNDYLKKIIQMYINLNEPEIAGQRYIDYMKMGGEKDLNIMNQIRDLKGLNPLTDFKQPNMNPEKK